MAAREIAFTLLLCLAALTYAGGRPLPEFQKVTPSGEVTPLLAPAKPIRSPSAPIVLPAPQPQALPGGYTRPFANAQLNARVAGTLPEGAWRVAWQVALEGVDPPRFVLQAGRRILVQATKWQLFGMDGTPLGTGQAGLSDIVLDPDDGLFYLADGDGYLNGRSLEDGRQVFATMLSFGDEYARSFLARRGRHMVVAGYERALDPHGHHRPENALLEVIDLGSPLRVDDIGLLESGGRLGEVHVGSTTLRVAMLDTLIVVAVPDRLLHLGLDLEARDAFDGEFLPVAMSLDEHGYAYLIVQVEGRLQYWLVAPDGVRVVQLTLPPPLLSVSTPPVVGYDRQAYLIANGVVMAVSPQGRLRWARPTQDPVGGAVVTLDHQLLVADGSDLAAFDEAGQRRVLYRFEGETLQTPPVLTATGGMLVATRQHLYSLVTDQPAQER